MLSTEGYLNGSAWKQVSKMVLLKGSAQVRTIVNIEQVIRKLSHCLVFRNDRKCVMTKLVEFAQPVDVSKPFGPKYED